MPLCLAWDYNLTVFNVHWKKKLFFAQGFPSFLYSILTRGSVLIEELTVCECMSVCVRRENGWEVLVSVPINDNTLCILEKPPVFKLPPAKFSHGQT